MRSVSKYSSTDMAKEVILGGEELSLKELVNKYNDYFILFTGIITILYIIIYSLKVWLFSDKTFKRFLNRYIRTPVGFVTLVCIVISSSMSVAYKYQNIMLFNYISIVMGVICIMSLVLSMKYFNGQRKIIEVKLRDLDSMNCTHDCETCKIKAIYNNDVTDTIIDFLDDPGDDVLVQFKGLDRLLISNTKTIVIYILGSGIACTGLIYSIIRLIASIYHSGIIKISDLTCNAMASSAIPNKAGVNPNLINGINYKNIGNIGVTIVICVAFLWAFGVSLHSTDKERVKTANDYVKMLLGFLIGTAKSYLLG